MKKALLLVFLLLIFFTSCESKPDITEQFSLPISFCASTNRSEPKYFVNIGDSACDIEFDESSTLYGVKLHFEEGKGLSVVGDHSLPIDENDFPAFKSLIRAVRFISSTKEDGVNEENTIKYTIDEMTILVYYDKDTEIVTGIRTEELGRIFEFTLSDLKPYEAQSNGAGLS